MLFVFATLLAYALPTQIKFLIGISAFWIAEMQDFAAGLHGNFPLAAGRVRRKITAAFAASIVAANRCDWLPFSSLYAFPMQLLLNQPQAATPPKIALDFARHIVWLAASLLVRFSWNRGTHTYQAYG